VGQNVPVVIGKRFVTDHTVQILGINQPLYDMYWGPDEFISYLLPAHGATHHAVSGSDPAYIDVRNILNGRVRPTDPETMTVYAESFSYHYQDERVLFGGQGVDLTNDVPGAANYQRYVLLSLDTIEQSLRKTLGLATPLAVAATPPSVPVWNISLALVLLYNGISTITDADIHDYRVVFDPIGAYNIRRSLIQYMQYSDIAWSKHLTGDI
jgi:hypothetical protein